MPSCSGYAERIHELIAVSRELGFRDSSSSQRNGSRNCFTEANYIEFSDVKVLALWQLVFIQLYFYFPLSFGYEVMFCDPQVVTPSNNVLVEDLTLKVDAGSNLLITGELVLASKMILKK